MRGFRGCSGQEGSGRRLRSAGDLPWDFEVYSICIWLALEFVLVALPTDDRELGGGISSDLGTFVFGVY